MGCHFRGVAAVLPEGALGFWSKMVKMPILVIAWVQNFCNGFLPKNVCSSYPFPTYAARILFRKLARIFARVFQPFFLCPRNPRQIHATLKSPNPRQFWKLVSHWFLWGLDPGMRRCFWMLMTNQTCRLTISVLEASSDTTQRAQTQ